MNDETQPAPDPSRPNSPSAPTRSIMRFLEQQGIETLAVNLDGSDDAAIPVSSEERYAINRELARGGMGAVLSAKDLNLRRDVAMKIVLDPHKARNDQILRFVHEAQVTGQLEHPSIVPVYELGVDAEDHVYYTMKYVRGTNLGELLKQLRLGDPATRERFPLSRLLDVFIRACEALAFAHSHGVIHRDLKPDNIMVGGFGEVLVVDWGLAKILHRDEEEPAAVEGAAEPAGKRSREARLVDSVRGTQAGEGIKTLDGVVMGTPAYMPPEQASGDIREMGPAADVYSMGAILYAILTLEPPVEGKTLDELLEKVCRGEVVPPALREGSHAHCPGGRIPPSLSAVTMKAMAPAISDRYLSVQDLQADVQAYLDGFATGAEEAGLWQLTKLFLARNRGLVVSVGVAAVLLTAAVSLSFKVNLQARRVAESEQTLAEQARADAAVARNKAEETLTDFREEQQKSLETRQRSAPAMVRAARAMIAEREIESAGTHIRLAQANDPGLAPAHLLAAQLHFAEEEYRAAEQALEAYRALVSDDPQADRLWELSGQLAVSVEEPLVNEVIKILYEQKAWTLADLVRQDQSERFTSIRRRFMVLWEHAQMDWLRQFTLRADGLIRVALKAGAGLGVPMHVNLSQADLDQLAGLPLGELSIPVKPQISDLTVVRGMPLRILDIRETSISDLSPLQGAPLEQLDLRGSPVSDLSPLRGMSLVSIHFSLDNISRGLEVLQQMESLKTINSVPADQFWGAAR